MTNSSTAIGANAPATFSLEQYADAVRGGHEPADILWLVRRLRGKAQPTLPGFKAGRRWRATAADIEKAIELLRPANQRLPELPRASSMTRTSRRRLAS